MTKIAREEAKRIATAVDSIHDDAFTRRSKMPLKNLGKAEARRYGLTVSASLLPGSMLAKRSEGGVVIVERDPRWYSSEEAGK